jgi:hypothetical protein
MLHKSMLLGLVSPSEDSCVAWRDAAQIRSRISPNSCLLVEFCLSTRMYVVTQGADEADSWRCGILTSCQEVPWEERGVGVCAMCTSLSLFPCTISGHHLFIQFLIF